MTMEISASRARHRTNVFRVHKLDRRGQAAPSEGQGRAQVAEFFRQLRPCLIGIEAARQRITGRVSCDLSGTAHG